MRSRRRSSGWSRQAKTCCSVFVVGAPLRRQGRLYNCAVAIHRGHVLGVVPKIFLPNYREFYERRHFTSGEGVRGGIDHRRRA